MSRRVFCAAVLAASLLWSVQKAAMAGTLHDALEDYAHGDYESSQRILRDLIADDPSDARYHYFMGATLLGLNRRSAALLEYRKCLQLPATEEIRDQCRSAIAAINAPRMAAFEMRIQHGKNSVSLAKRQSLSHLQQRTDEHRSVTDQIVEKARITAQAIKDEAKQVAKDWVANYSIRMRPYGQADEDAAEIQRIASEQAEGVMKKAISEAESRERAYQEKKAQLELSANNLESQMQQSATHDGVQLSPIGTNLFVRSYIH